MTSKNTRNNDPQILEYIKDEGYNFTTRYCFNIINGINRRTIQQTS